MSVPSGEMPPSPPSGPAPKKSWLKWILLGCFGLVVLIAAFAGIMFFVVKKATAGPEAAVQGFLAAAGRGDYAAAHDYFSAPLKEAQPLDEFEAAVKSQPAMFKVKETTFNTRSADLNGAKLAGTLTLESGTKMPASFKLVKENEAWKLISYKIGAGAEE